jgi:hypothetical protein
MRKKILIFNLHVYYLEKQSGNKLNFYMYIKTAIFIF